MVNVKLNTSIFNTPKRVLQKIQSTMKNSVVNVASSRIFTLWWRWSLLLGITITVIWGYLSNWQFSDWVYFDSQANMHTRRFIPELLFLSIIVMPVLAFTINSKSGFKNFIGWILMLIICFIWIILGIQTFFTVLLYFGYFVACIMLIIIMLIIIKKILEIKIVKNSVDVVKNKIYIFFTAKDKN